MQKPNLYPLKSRRRSSPQTRPSSILCIALTCSLTGCQSIGSSVPSSENPNHPPTATHVKIHPESPQTNDLLFVELKINDPDNDPVSTEYLWSVNDTVVSSSPTLDGNHFDKGDSIVVTVTTNDGEDQGPSVNSAEVIVQNTPPEIGSADLSNTAPTETTTLTVTVGGLIDPDQDAITYDYTWNVNGSIVSSEETLDGSHFDKGDSIFVSVTPNDGEDQGPTVHSALVIAQNTPPLIGSVDLSSTAPTETTTLTVTVGGPIDPDQDAITYDYAWYVNGLVASNKETLDGTHFNKGDSIFVSVTPDDGEDQGPALNSATTIVQNTAPEIGSLSLSTNTPTETDTLSVNVTGVSDPDGDTVSLQYEWYVNANLTSTDLTLDSAAFNKGDSIHVVVTPNDGEKDGPPLTSVIAVVQNSLPEIGDLSLSTTTPTETDILAVSVTGVIDSDADIVDLRYAWYVNASLVASTPTINGNLFDKGDTIYVSVTPNDGEDDGPTVSTAPVTVLNSVPEIGSISLSSTTPITTDTLTATVNSPYDADGDPITYHYDWRVNGLTASTAQHLDSALFVRDDTIDLIITPDDGHDRGVPVSSELANVLNSPPTITTLDLSNPQPTTIDDLGYTLTTADLDGDRVKQDIAWTVNGVLASTDPTLDHSLFQKDDSIELTITPFDQDDQGTAVSASAVVQNSLPEIGDLSLSTSTPTETDILAASVTGVTDSDADTVDLHYDWYVNASLVASTPTIDGDLFDKGDAIYVSVTPNDGEDQGATVTSPTVIAQNTPPLIGSVELSNAAPTETTTLTVTLGGLTDPDQDAITYDYAWYVNGLIASNEETLNGNHFNKGDSIFVAVTPDDGEDQGPTINSATTIVQNIPPQIGSLSLSTSTPTETDTLSVNVAGLSDPDGDTVSLQYEWYVNASLASTNPTVNGSDFHKGDSIYVVVTPNDGEMDGNTLTSAIAIAQNTPPEIGTLSLSTTAPTENDILAVSVTGITDSDADTIDLRYAWYVNASLVASTPTIDGSLFERGDVIHVSVTPNDGEEDGLTVSTAPVTVLNSIPEIGSINLSSTAPITTETITATINSPYDADGDPIAYHYDWRVNGLTASTAPQLDSALFVRHDTIDLIITPDDGQELGVPVSSELATVLNSPPTITALDLSNPQPTTIDDLSYTLTTADLDGDPVEHDIAWTINGVLASTDPTLDHSLFHKGDSIELTITPFDQDDHGPAVSASAVVQNTPPLIADIVFSPDVLYTDDRLLAWVTPEDVDEEPVDIHYNWTVNGTAIAHNDLNLSGKLFFDKGDLVELVVELDDGTVSVFSSPYSFTVEDHPPFAPAVVLGPENPIEGQDDLRCSITADGWDPDQDLISHSIRWTVDGVDYTGPLSTTTLTHDTIPTDQWTQGEDWRCLVTANDGFQDGTESSSYTPDLSTPPNLLVILIDDVGVDRLALYGQNPYPAPTPNIDALAEQGLLFRRAYAQPTCSPTRAAMLTGRNIRRYGIGKPFSSDDGELPLDEVTLPEALSMANYTSSAIGKWHVSAPFTVGGSGYEHPNLQGFDHYSGTPRNLSSVDPDSGSFFEWEHIVDGVSLGLKYDYLTTYETDDAIQQVQTLAEPWFVWLGYHAVHVPFEPPPAPLHGYTSVTSSSPPWERADAMLEALDTEIGRLLDAMSPDLRERTTIILVGDNGTVNGSAMSVPPPIRDVPEWGERAKGTVYERGVHVPLIIAGPAVRQPGAEVEALVHLLDLYPTAASLAGIDPTTVAGAKPIDGHSLLPILQDASASTARSVLLTEHQAPNGPGPYTTQRYMARNDRYKLIELNGREKFFDLERDIDSASNNLLLGSLTADEQTAYDELRQALDDAETDYSYEY